MAARSTGRPRRMKSAMRSPTEIANTAPEIVPTEVGRHSEIVLRITGFVAIPRAYRQAPTPNGFTSVAAVATRPARRVRPACGSRSIRSSRRARPANTGTSTKAPCRFAIATANTGSNQIRLGWSRRPASTQRHAARSGRAKSCGRSARPRSPSAMPANVRRHDVRRPDPRCTAGEVHEAVGRPDQHGPEHYQGHPPAGSMNQRERHLRAPLLIQPPDARRRERVRVDPGERARREDPVAGPDLIGEIDGAHRRGERHQEGHEHRQQCPEAVEVTAPLPCRHAAILRAAGPSLRRRSTGLPEGAYAGLRTYPQGNSEFSRTPQMPTMSTGGSTSAPGRFFEGTPGQDGTRNGRGFTCSFACTPALPRGGAT